MASPIPPVIAIATIAAVEAIGLVGYGVFALVEVVRLGATGPEDVSNAPAIAVQTAIFVAFGIGMAFVARGWWMERRWARAPFVLAQLMALVVGVPLAQGSGAAERVAGIVLSLAAILGIVLTFTPAVMRSTED